MSTFDRHLETKLDALRKAGLARTPPRIDHREGVHYRVDGHPVTGFCSNDYLGLANHPSFASLPLPNSGATASRLICGDHPIHRQVELRLASLVGTADAVLFPSGFQLNVGVLPALIQPEDEVFSDLLNHASLIDGLRLSSTRPTILPHLAAPPSNNSWWITEALFSMDGDYADPLALKNHLASGGLLYLDEAHSLALFKNCTGLAGHHGIHPTLLVGTLGKSFGCAGAFAAASITVCTWLRACARSFVYSTGLSPAVASQILHAIDLASGPEGDTRRDRLWHNIDHFIRQLRLTIPEPQRSPIFSIPIGPNDATVSLSTALLERGWHVQAIRPPTVPVGTARLRITLSASHTSNQISRFAEDLQSLLDAHKLAL